MIIRDLTARMILDSRGYPTIEVDITLDDGSFGRASTPSGASTGSREALEKRDNDTKHYDGKGVTTVLTTILTILKPALIGTPFVSQRELDQKLIALDASKNKINFGANALLPISLAYARACANAKNIPLYAHLREEYTFSKEASLPTPLINVLNGGKHASHSTDIQEWMIVPRDDVPFATKLEMAAAVFYALRKNMAARGISGVGDEGGFPLHNAVSNKEALVILTQAVKQAELVPGKDIFFALDVAASELSKGSTYMLSCEKRSYSQDELIQYYRSLLSDFPIISIEDPFDENDWQTWKKFTHDFGAQLQIVGDDLFVTNTDYIRRGIDEKSANSVLIKLNQIGTLSETVDAIELAHSAQMKTIISHRSGETEDTFIAHLAVASGAGQIKTGSLSRTERLAKYNELLRISEQLQK